MPDFIEITVDPPDIRPEVEESARRIRERVVKALDAASKALAANILEEGRRDIAGAGKFGPRWTTGFTADVEGEGTIRTLTFRHNVSYWRVHQFGAVIRGKPLLWIPLSFAGLAPGTRAAGFPGGLFRVNRKSGGAPLLLSIADKQPKFSGHESVRIPKRFHLVEIIRAESKTLGALYQLELTNV